jgi:NAD(P)-dependent dehydrogenase (short-subunit alcohol dehydrogenase family)
MDKKMMEPSSLQSIKETINSAKHVCLFGIGSLIEDCFYQLVLFLGREPDFFCDNAQGKWGGEYFRKRCISPRELAEMGSDTVVIITVKRYEDICQDVFRMGFRDVFVCCFDRCYNTLQSVKRLEVNPWEEGKRGAFISPVRGKWVFITGAARGIGRRISLEMAKLGANIIAHSRSVSHVDEVIEECSALGVKIVPIAAELSNLNEVERMLSDLEHLAPQIDIVFNNAAISLPFPSGFWSGGSESYLVSYIVNTIAPIRICQRLIPLMIKRGFGRVINISSSIQKRPNEMAYACSKAALDKFVHDLAPSLQETGVMLTLVDPGWLRTDMGGPTAPCSVESVIPGALLGALLEGDINGRWFGAQDYAGLSIEEAIRKAKFIFSF